MASEEVIHINMNSHQSDYHNIESRKRQHRIHYSRIKSAAIAASYRLMHVSTDNVLVRKTANAAVNGMRPEHVKAAQELKQQIESDIVLDEMYNHKRNIEPISDLCLVQEPRRNRDVMCFSFLIRFCFVSMKPHIRIFTV